MLLFISKNIRWKFKLLFSHVWLDIVVFFAVCIPTCTLLHLVPNYVRIIPKKLLIKKNSKGMLTWHIWPGSTLQEEEEDYKVKQVQTCQEILPWLFLILSAHWNLSCSILNQMWSSVYSTIVCELCVCVYSQEVEKLKVFSPGKIRVEDHFLTKS